MRTVHQRRIPTASFPLLRVLGPASLAVWLGALPSAQAVNLVRDGSIEESDVNMVCEIQGLLPDPWFSVSSTPDTYTSDCAQRRGLDNAFATNFQSIANVAQHGLRFVAGWGLGAEALGTPLASPLTAGTAYRLTGYFTPSNTHPTQGDYAVYLSADKLFDAGDVLLGRIGDTAVTLGSWALDVLDFIAPVGAGSLGYVIFFPKAATDCYIGMDNLVLVESVAASATIRNDAGNLNPLVYSSLVNLPVLGSTWNPRIDASGHPGAGLTVAVGAFSAVEVPSGFGVVLVDISVPFAAVSVAPSGGGTAVHSIAVPASILFAGVPVFTQGAILGGGVELTNALDIVLGF